MSLALAAFGLISIAWALTRPKGYVLMLLVFTVFAKPIDKLTSGLTAYFDEVGVVVALLAVLISTAVRREKFHSYPGLLFFIVFVLFGLISGWSNGVEPGLNAAGAFLATKGLWFGLAVVQLKWTERDVRAIVRGGLLVFWFIILTSMLNFISPNEWNARFASSGLVDVRFGLPSLIGPFVHPADLGITLAIGSLAVGSYAIVYGGGWRAKLFATLLAFFSFLSMRTKTWAGLAVAGSWLVAQRSRRASTVLLAVVLLPLVGVLLWDEIQRFAGDLGGRVSADSQSNPRLALATGAIQVASGYFPLGAGFSRYGSFLAAENYSPEYVRLGYNAIWGLNPAGYGYSEYLTDTQWPSFLGEAGWFGVWFYALAVLRMFSASRSATTDSRTWVKFFGLAAVGILIQVAVESVAGPAFLASPSFGPVFFAVALAVSAARSDELVSGR